MRFDQVESVMRTIGPWQPLIWVVLAIIVIGIASLAYKCIRR
jgi:hypothetical protein